MPIKLNGSSSGFTQIDAASVAGNNTLTLPTASGTLMTTGGTNTFTANQVIEVTDNTNAALRITQLGTADAIRVEDSTNPDSTPFVVDASGNVGIGTASPGVALDVRGQIRSGGTQQGKFLGHNTSGTLVADIGVATGTGSSDSIGIYNVTSTGVLNFGTNSTERMRIGSDGIVSSGIVSNTTPFSRFVPTGNVGYLDVNHPTGTGSGNWYMAFALGASGVIGTITQSGTTGVAYNTTSDYRLKENIVPLSGASERVLSLKPSRFNFKEEPDRTVDGFLAHEAQEVVPEAVTGEKDAADEEGNPVYQGIDQSKLVPLLTAALQEALTKIDALEARLATLENA